MIPLPREIFDHSLSDDQLQDRWVAGAERKVVELREQKARLLDDLAALRKSLADAETFLAEAKERQRHYRETKTQPVPRPSQVQALLTRRTPAQVQALLDGARAQGTEIAGPPNGEEAIDATWRPLLLKP